MDLRVTDTIGVLNIKKGRDVSTLQNTNMDKRGDDIYARYGVDIRPARWHIETNDLAQILPVLNGHIGRVTVRDRTTESIAFEGNVDEVRTAIANITGSHGIREADAASSIRSEDVHGQRTSRGHPRGLGAV